MAVPGTMGHLLMEDRLFSTFLYNAVRCLLKIRVLEIFFTWIGTELLYIFFRENAEILLASIMSQLSIFVT